MHIEGTPEEIHKLLSLLNRCTPDMAGPLTDLATAQRIKAEHEASVRARKPSPVKIAPVAEVLPVDEVRVAGEPVAEVPGVNVVVVPNVEAADEIIAAPNASEVPEVGFEVNADNSNAAPAEFDTAAVHAVGEVALLTSQPALVLAVLMAYDADPRMTVGRLYEAVRHEPIKSTQANLRLVRAELIGQELIATKGKRSPHNVTPKGRALVTSLQGGEAATVAVHAASAANEAPPADDGLVFLDDAPKTAAEVAQEALAAPPATPPTVTVTLEEMRASLKKLVVKLGTGGKPAIKGLLTHFGVDDILSLPKESWDNFNAAVLDVLATEAA